MKGSNILIASSAVPPFPALAKGTKSTFSVEDIQGWNGESLIRQSERIAGYRGIWFALGFKFKYGDKYSGGLGTYTANHQPMAIYSAVANQTFFTYGGTLQQDKREL